MRKIIMLIIAICIFALLSGCAVSRSYKTEYAKDHDKDILYKAALQSLTDMRFIITESDIDAGVVSAFLSASNLYTANSNLSIVITESKETIFVNIAGSGPGNSNSVSVVERKIKSWYENLSGKKPVEVKSVSAEPEKKKIAEVTKPVKTESKETKGKKTVGLKVEIGGYMLGDNKTITNLNSIKWEDVTVEFIYFYGGGKKVFYTHFDKVRPKKTKTVKIKKMGDSDGNPPAEGIGKPDEIVIKAIMNGEKKTFYWESNK